MEIANPRRILILSPPSTDLTVILSALDSSKKSLNLPSVSSQGSSLTSSSIDPATDINYEIKTKYYSACIPVWIDTIVDPASWAQEWLNMPGAEEVVNEIEAWIVVFNKPDSKEGWHSITALLKTVSDTIAKHVSDAYGVNTRDYVPDDCILLAVAIPQGSSPGPETEDEEWADICWNAGGWDYVNAGRSGSNEWKEETGLAKLLRSLECGEWAPRNRPDDQEETTALSQEDGEKETEARDEEGSSGRIEHFSKGEMEALLEPIFGQETDPEFVMDADEEQDTNEDSGNDVESLERFLHRAQAIKDMVEDMPKSERKKTAAKAVQQLMKEL